MGRCVRDLGVIYGCDVSGGRGWEGRGAGIVAARPLPTFALRASVGPSLLSGRGWPEVPEPTPSSCQNNYWYFRIAADRFLRNMVRATVGSLIEVGRGKHAPEWIAELIESGTRGDAGESVPGHALFLNKVLY